MSSWFLVTESISLTTHNFLSRSSLQGSRTPVGAPIMLVQYLHAHPFNFGVSSGNSCCHSIDDNQRMIRLISPKNANTHCPTTPYITGSNCQRMTEQFCCCSAASATAVPGDARLFVFGPPPRLFRFPGCWLHVVIFRFGWQQLPQHIAAGMLPRLVSLVLKFPLHFAEDVQLSGRVVPFPPRLSADRHRLSIFLLTFCF